MNQQQLNKIDEEFDEKFKEVITTANYHLDTGVSCISLEDIKDFIHSKLQEAYEQGCQDTKDAALKLANEYCSTNDYGNTVIDNADMLLLDIKSEL